MLREIARLRRGEKKKSSRSHRQYADPAFLRCDDNRAFDDLIKSGIRDEQNFIRIIDNTRTQIKKLTSSSSSLFYFFFVNFVIFLKIKHF